MIDINKVIEQGKEYSKLIEKIREEILNNPDVPQESKEEFIKLYKDFEKKKIDYAKKLEDNKHRKIIGFDPENFEPIYEDE